MTLPRDAAAANRRLAESEFAIDSSSRNLLSVYRAA
jgi:hypothetical protein